MHLMHSRDFRNQLRAQGLSSPFRASCVRKPRRGNRWTGWEWHPRMTEISLRRIAEAGADRFATRAVAVVHRCGDILPGETIVLVAVASDHRRDAFLAAEYIMDRLKTDAVFWKREVGTFGSRWIEPTQRDQQDRTRWNNDQGQD